MLIFLLPIHKGYFSERPLDPFGQIRETNVMMQPYEIRQKQMQSYIIGFYWNILFLCLPKQSTCT